MVQNATNLTKPQKPHPKLDWSILVVVEEGSKVGRVREAVNKLRLLPTQEQEARRCSGALDLALGREQCVREADDHGAARTDGSAYRGSTASAYGHAR